MKRYILILIAIIFLSTFLSAQDKSQPEHIKNAIFVELESIIMIGDVAINYERNLIAKNNNSFLFNLRGGFGKYYIADLGGTEKGLGFKMSVNLLKGNGRNYFETNFGLGFGNVTICQRQFDNCPDWRIWPIVNIGYRYQSAIILRCYFGSLGIGFSLGFNLS